MMTRDLSSCNSTGPCHHETSVMRSCQFFWSLESYFVPRGEMIVACIANIRERAQSRRDLGCWWDLSGRPSKTLARVQGEIKIFIVQYLQTGLHGSSVIWSMPSLEGHTRSQYHSIQSIDLLKLHSLFLARHLSCQCRNILEISSFRPTTNKGFSM